MDYALYHIPNGARYESVRQMEKELEEMFGVVVSIAVLPKAGT